ncbi:MAG: ATP-binding cassette domain-containing protein [Oscillospiraceae bacterium]|nr:ATP-binding cassette domain-containing protein [Oscillospiraceae bacterium]
MKIYQKVPTVFQMEATECGAAALSMIFRYYGKYLPLEQMRIETGVSRDGSTAKNLMRCAKSHGLKCRGFRKECQSLKELNMPCIIHWNFNHFVVLEGFRTTGFGKHRRECVYLNDPAAGRRVLSWEELEEGFTGVVLTFEKTEAFQPEKQTPSLLPLIRQRLEGNYHILFQLVYIGILLVFPGLVLPVLSQMFIDDILTRGYTDWLVKILVFMGGLVILKAGLHYYRDLMLQKLSAKLSLISGVDFLRHMLHLPMSFFDQRFSGDLVSRMNSNTEVCAFLSGDLAETVLNILVAVFYLLILLFYSPVMTLIGLVTVGINIAMVLLTRQYLSDASNRQELSEGKLFGALCSGLSITDTLKASGAENAYISRMLGYHAKTANLEQDQTRVQKILSAIPAAAGNITDVLHILVGGILVINGQMSLGMLTAFVALFDSFIQPVNSLVDFARNIQSLKAGLNRVEDVLQYPQDPRYSQDGTFSRKLSGRVQLLDVAFGYSSLKPPLVENFSFQVFPGESIAFVGPSGCGKSTVSQNITLFTGTIRDNITMWNSAVSEADLIKAAQDACIHDFILTCPGGYDYRLTENAMNLSGGQRQRLEIARALASNPSILVMDEATSALDPITEKQVLANIRRRGCTCIIVAHRLSAFRDCNEILVMDNGSIVQRGTHEQLMAQEGLYRTFVQNT